MKILVTGSTGFIGSHVISYLLRNGHQVVATSSDTKKAQQLNWFHQVRYVEFVLEDSIESTTDLYTYFDRPDAMLHLAWQGLPYYNESYHVDKNLFSQYSFVKNLINNGLKNISITGTCLEYGLINGCLSESQIGTPSNFYAVAKDSLRKFIELHKEKYDLSFKWIRLFYMYGEGQNPKSLIPQLEEAVRTGSALFKMSGGEQIRDYLHISEVAEYLSKIALQSSVDGIINCCSGKPITVRKFIENYMMIHGMNIKLELGYYPYPDYEPFAFWGDCTKLNKILSNEF